MHDTEAREVAINIRARSSDRDLIDQAAEALGKNRSEFMMEAACQKARDVLLDQTFFALDAPTFRRFREVLDQPLPRRNRAALRQLLRRQTPWER